jgi:hypothetical protein
MKIYKTLLAVFVSATCAFGSPTVDQLKFTEISGASKGITVDSLAIADSDALTLGPSGSVARIGIMPQGLRFDIEKIMLPSSKLAKMAFVFIGRLSLARVRSGKIAADCGLRLYLNKLIC